MKLISTLFLLMTIISCSNKEDINGKWKLEIKLQNQILPVLIELKNENNQLNGVLINSSEKIPLYGTLVENKFKLEIGANYAILDGEIKNNKLTGSWIRTNKENYQVAFTGVKTNLDSLYKGFESVKTPLNISGNWKIKLKEDKYGLGLFTQKGARVQGSILTNTGDYRYLDGHIKGGNLTLTGFDGVFSYVIKLGVKPNEFIGIMHAGKSYKAEISAVKDQEFTLDNPLEIAKAVGKTIEVKNKKSINGELVDTTGEDYKGKAKIIQIFGSWCPNCIDETHFFVKWRKENQAKLNDIKFIALAFEKFDKEKDAIKALKKTMKKVEMDYPIVLLDHKTTKTVENHLPIENFKAFPTTIFLNKNDEIIKIHTGFAGQATGPFFDQFVQMFNETVDKLIKE